MANIKVTVNGALSDGQKITFKAPCSCSEIEKIKVCYINNGTQVSRLFTMKDSHGNDLTGIGNLFSKGAYVHVILDTVNGFAFLLNADTNTYLEQRIKTIFTYATEIPTEVPENTIVLVYEE